jgi:hypothetical protein
MGRHYSDDGRDNRQCATGEPELPDAPRALRSGSRRTVCGVSVLWERLCHPAPSCVLASHAQADAVDMTAHCGWFKQVAAGRALGITRSGYEDPRRVLQPVRLLGQQAELCGLPRDAPEEHQSLHAGSAAALGFLLEQLRKHPRHVCSKMPPAPILTSYLHACFLAEPKLTKQHDLDQHLG